MQILPPTARPENNNPLVELVCELFHKHYQQMWRVASRLSGNTADLDDIVQQVFMEFFSRLHDKGVPPNPKAWLFRALHSRVIDRVRRARTVEEKSKSFSIITTDSSSLEREVESSNLVETYLDLLDVKERGVLILLANGLRYEEVAEVLDMSTQSVGVYAFRARKKIRERAGNSHE